jgi:cysteine synthase B
LNFYQQTERNKRGIKMNNHNLLAAIGHTPLVELTHLNQNPKVKIYGKLEGLNPGGSVKDRPAYYMIKKAEASGELTRDKIILEPTSGNMGIALAMIGAVKGYKVKLVIPACVTPERRQILEAFGAEVLLTPGEEGTDGAIKRAYEILEKEPDKYYLPNQFENENNVISHYKTTGPEIFSQTGGEIDAFVAGIGSTGTLMGVGQYLKEKKPGVKIVGVEPGKRHAIQGLKNLEESMVPKIYNPGILDRKITVEDDEAIKITRLLATREGLLVGMSSGAAVAGALRLARDMESGTIVTLLPDRGERYLSARLFRSLCAKCPP